MAETISPVNNTAVENVAVSSGDRLSFTVFLAAVIHGMVIFGVAFNLSSPDENAPSVTVTIATHESDKEPDDADFIAQANQEGSGTLETAKQITTDQLSPFISDQINTAHIDQQTKTTPQSLQEKQWLTASQSETVITTQTDEEQPIDKKQGKDNQDIQKITQEIASLQAKLANQRQQYAKRPRERVLTSVSTKAAKDAAYLNEWTRKVENYGNKNFPQEAINQRITGKLRLQSVIRWDGALIEAAILESSGHRILDSAALQIIHQAAPFAPFPPEIRKDTDQLAIIRTWIFELDGLSTSQ